MPFALFAIPLAELPLVTTLEQDELLQSWKLSVPVSPASGSLNVALTCVAFTRAAAAGETSAAVAGGTVSTTKLDVPDQPDTLPAESVDSARQ